MKRMLLSALGVAMIYIGGIREIVAEPTGSTVPAASKRDFYCDPMRGNMAGDGSKTHPWGKLEDVLAANLINGQDPQKGAVHAGDRILLMSGNHGILRITLYSGQFVNTDFITVAAAPDQEPVINSLLAQDSCNWAFQGLTFTNPPTVPKWHTLARFDNCKNIVFERNTLFSQPDVSMWKSEDWISQGAWLAIEFNGERASGATIRNNKIFNVRCGITIGGDNILLSNNSIDYFCDDGIDFTSSNTVIRGNVITNHFGKVEDGNHNDGIQGWTIGGRQGRNVTIDGNTVIVSTGTHATIPPIPTSVTAEILQGISIFDGEWSNVQVTNNVVVSSAYHGMAWYGLSDSLIANNTVLRQSSNRKITTWLAVFPSRKGLAPSNVVVRNNIASRFELHEVGVVDDHNISLDRYNKWTTSGKHNGVGNVFRLFVACDSRNARFDLRLKKDSPAIGAGQYTDLVQTDITGMQRDRDRFDIGAYAFRAE